MQMDDGTIDRVERGRESYRRRAWADAYAVLSAADQVRPLDPEDLELLATCAYLMGRDIDFQRTLERAHQRSVAGGDSSRAARAAFWLGLTSLLRGQVGIATGWLSRAGRLVESLDCVERGYLLLPLAEQQLAERASNDAYAASTNAAAIGERFGDADLVAFARHLQGRSLLQQGQRKAGLALLDETMLAAAAGDLSPIVTGLIYCSVIESCQDVCAYGRAREWTTAFAGWCEQQPDMLAFSGTCLVYRAEILQFQGQWSEAMTEATRACDRAAQAKRKPPAAAFYRQGEIFRLRGDFAEAEAAYLRASQLGGEPQPGLALLRMAQQRQDAACTAIRRVMKATSDPVQRVKLLPALVEIMLAGGEFQEARGACAALDELAASINTEVVHAITAQARGTLELVEADGRTALAPLRRAFHLWQQLDAPYAAARVRVLLGLACRSLGDLETAQFEFAAARGEFQRLGAAPDLAQLDAIERQDSGVRRSPLTSRELEVLRLIAAGQTNREIARGLSLSERTIDRHVSNILTKLDVPSRAAATAYAYNHRLF